MSPDQLRALQAPLKDRYRKEPDAAVVTLRAKGALDPAGVACRVETASGVVVAGLHPATGGDWTQVCSGDLLLEALVACAGVTMNAVATAMGIAIRSGTVSAEGEIDFRGTLGVAKDAPVGFREIRLRFDVHTDAPQEKVAKLVQLTERYCVVYQTLRAAPAIAVTHAVAG